MFHSTDRKNLQLPVNILNCIPLQLACYNGMVKLLVIILLAETQVM
jgi:hypothetical protein